VRSVPRFENPEKRTGLIVWSGPVLAGDRLLLSGSNGQVLSISPYSGDLLSYIELPDPIAIAPVVVGKTVYFLTEDADLIAWR
jgi:outer membrane protein assembly factor BamB